jgi:preprotein translocase subunit SecD
MLAIRTFLAAFLLALTTLIAPAHAQSSTEIILQLDGDSLLANELSAASRKARVSLGADNPISHSRPEIAGRRLVVPLRDGRDAEPAITQLKQALEGYDIILRIDGAIEATLTDATLAHRVEAAGAAALTAARGRLDRSYHRDVNVVRRNVSQLVVTVPAYEGKSAEDVIALLTRPGIVTFNLVDEGMDAREFTPLIPRNGRVALPDDSLNGDLRVVHTDPIVSSDGFASAIASFDDFSHPSISFQLSPGATQLFGRATTQMVGRSFAIVVDGRIISAPTAYSPITTGSGQITGRFTIAEAERLAAILDSPPMPARLIVIETRVADPPR